MTPRAHRHTIHQRHHGWDHSIAAVTHIAPGDSLEFEVADASGGQLTATSTVADVGRMDFGKINPVTGPVYIDGAEPGDILKVTLLSFAPSGWGWTANIPGFGLLAEDFKEPALHIWRYDAKSLAPALFGPWGKVPLKPFTGTIGVALAEPGLHSIVPPRRVGGNMDVRDISRGTELFLPVEVQGGPVLGRRYACGARRRRGVRHRDRKPHARGAAIRPDQTDALDLPALQDLGAGHEAS